MRAFMKYPAVILATGAVALLSAASGADRDRPADARRPAETPTQPAARSTRPGATPPAATPTATGNTRQRNNRRPNNPAAENPTAVGKVKAYELGKSVAVEVARRGGKTETLQFGIDAERTRLEVPEGVRIEVGTTVFVWAEKDDAKRAARIVAMRNMAGAGSPRRPGTRPNAAVPGTPVPPNTVPTSVRPGRVPGAAMPAAAMSAPNRRPSDTADALAMVALILPKTVRPPVAGLRPEEVAREIDRYIDEKLSAAKVPASPQSDDAEFLRRVYLDITGVLPDADKAAAFLVDRDPQKRARLIDELLESPEYGRHFADLWCDRIAIKDTPIHREPFIAWMSESLNRGRGWNELVREMLSAEGKFGLLTRGSRLRSDDPRGLLMVLNTEAGTGGPKTNPALLAAETGRLFLGVQIQCAECHDHPFSSAWKQTDFWGLAAFFSEFRAGGGGGQGGFQWNEPAVADGAQVSIAIPATSLKNVGQVVPARLLAGQAAYRPDGERVLRHELARWITAAENPFFARASANRLWADFFGRGLVDPVNDLRPDNPPSHPEILALLADEFVKADFDYKHLVRSICLSRAYQRSSVPQAENEQDDGYARMPVRIMGPGVFYDSLAKATGLGELKLGLPERKTKLTVATTFTPREVFVDFYRAAQGEEADPLENSHGIPQALKLMNAAQLNGIAPVVREAAAGNRSREQVVERLYLSTLSRRPTPAELELTAEFLGRRASADPLEAYSALLWALVNSAEFVSNH